MSSRVKRELESRPSGSVLIVGAGPGLGAAVARRFAREGMPVAISSRNRDNLNAVASGLQGEEGPVLAVPGDATSPDDVRRVVAEVEKVLGPVGVLIYNAGNYVHGRLMELTPERFEQALAVGVYGAFLYSSAVYESMKSRGEGVLLFTGATTSVMPPGRAPAFAAAKFGLRGFALSLARDVRHDGIHVAHVIVDGVIETPATREQTDWAQEELVDPEGIADAYWYLATQPPRAWSFELDLRTSEDDYLDN